MKSKRVKSVVVAAILAASGWAAQAQEIKIGYVNSERVLRESNMAKAAYSKLEAEFGKREKELKELEVKLRSAAEKFDKDSTLLADAEKARRQRDLVEQDRELQRKRREFQEDLQERKGSEMQVLVERANRVTKQIFEAEKFDLILQDALHFSARVDITKKVIDALNAQK